MVTESPEKKSAKRHSSKKSAASKDQKQDVRKILSEPRPYEEQIKLLVPFAKPLASKKTNKRALKIVKKATKAKHVRRGVKEVVKALRKGEKGLVFIAGDISPMDVISHIPVLCEDKDVPYLFTPSKEELGFAGSTKRPTSVVMIVPGGKKKNMDEAREYLETYEEVSKEATEASLN